MSVQPQIGARKGAAVKIRVGNAILLQPRGQCIDHQCGLRVGIDGHQKYYMEAHIFTDAEILHGL